MVVLGSDIMQSVCVHCTLLAVVDLQGKVVFLKLSTRLNERKKLRIIDAHQPAHISVPLLAGLTRNMN